MEKRIRDNISPNGVNKAVKLEQNIKTLPCMTLFTLFCTFSRLGGSLQDLRRVHL